MRRRIDPTVDCVFKAILGKEENKNLLVHFLNAILRPRGTRRIVDVVIANPYNEREFLESKLSIVDVKATDMDGRQYQIEVQRVIHAGLKARMLFTWSALYHGQLGKGEDFLRLRPVIAIWLVREPLFPAQAAYHLPFGLYNLRHRLRLTDQLAIHVLQIPKWHVPPKRVEARDRWMYFFKYGGALDPARPPRLLQTKEMTQAMSVLVEFSEKEKDYLLYEQRLEAERMELTWQKLLAQAAEKIARAERIEREQQEKECERREKERLLQEKEREQQEKEREQQEKERERREKERLLLEKEREYREKERQLLQELERLQTLLQQSGVETEPPQ